MIIELGSNGKEKAGPIFDGRPGQDKNEDPEGHPHYTKTPSNAQVSKLAMAVGATAAVDVMADGRYLLVLRWSNGQCIMVPADSLEEAVTDAMKVLVHVRMSGGV